MQDKDQEHKAFVKARQAVELLLRLGSDSYHPDIIAENRGLVGVSPLAGQEITSKLVDGMCVGPVMAASNFHVTMRLLCNGREVEAYCTVTSDARRIQLIQASVYVDGLWATHRNLSVFRDGRLDPWGTPEGFTVTDQTIEATTP